jgi:diguanylate cyclase
MMQRMLGILTLMLLLLLPAVSLQAAIRYGDLLKEADTVKSAKPERFFELIDELEKRQREADSAETQRYLYFKAFKTAVYDDQYADGIRQASVVFKQTKDVELKFRVASLIVNLTAINRDFSTGLTYLDRTIALRKQIKDRTERHYGIGAAATFYNQMGQYSLGLKYAKEVLKDNPVPRTKCFMGSTQLEAQYVLRQLPESDAAVESVLSECLRIGELMAASITRATLARKWAASGQIEKAVSLLEKSALPDVLLTKNPRIIAEIRSLLSELKLKTNDIKAAQDQAVATVALGDAIKSTRSLVTAYSTLYQIAEREGQYAKALGFYKQYAEAEKAYLGDVKAREVVYAMFREKTQQQSQQLAFAEKNLELVRRQQALERESAQKARLAMVFLMLILAGIIFWVIQIKRHQSQLQRLAQTDTLTGLGNRHFFTLKSERALIDAARAGQPAALVMFDLDHFKAINDTYGHGAGDWVLKQVGKTCSSQCRKVDYLGRIGGEEFAVLLHGLDLSTAARVAEECRSQLAQIDTRECGYSFVVTASFGVSSTAQSGYDLSRLLSHADQMLYRAKNEGRNRVCAYNAETAADYKSPKRAPTLSVVGS